MIVSMVTTQIVNMSLDKKTKEDIGELFDEKLKPVYEIIKSNHDEIKPVLDAIKAITVGRKAIFWVTTLIVAIGGAVFTIKKLF